MRAHAIDPNGWRNIQADISALCDELAGPGWDTLDDTVAAHVFRLLDRAAFLAAFCQMNPRLTMSKLRELTGPQ